LREFTLEEVVDGGLYAENVWVEDVFLRYRPELQRKDMNPLLEAHWPGVWHEDNWRLVEIFKSGDEWGCAPAPVSGNGFPKGGPGGPFRLPHIPGYVWTHKQECDCSACQEEGSSEQLED
jgi:hypothetical protein